MNKSASTFKKQCSPDFTEIIRGILYSNRITWGAKCLAFAILDSPPNKVIKNAVLARRLSSSPQQIAVWLKELVQHKLLLQKKIN